METRVLQSVYRYRYIESLLLRPCVSLRLLLPVYTCRLDDVLVKNVRVYAGQSGPSDAGGARTIIDPQCD